MLGFCRHCSALDFWSINDHAEATTPKRWMETKETIRKCNALNVDPANPDCVAFLGWEWTQVGVVRGNHWGHHNVILKEEDDQLVPPRAIASLSVARQAMTARPLLPGTFTLLSILKISNVTMTFNVIRWKQLKYLIVI